MHGSDEPQRARNTAVEALTLPSGEHAFARDPVRLVA
jgi:hypothetical protein